MTATLASSTPMPRHFEPDHCASCLTALAPQVEQLFCTELCRQTAEVVRYWRRIRLDGRISRPDVHRALATQLALLAAGGYPTQARRLSTATKRAVRERDRGRCQECGASGDEIDHIDGDSPALGNLQLLCTPCHHRKTDARLIPASRTTERMIHALELARVTPTEPALLCDDHERWASIERTLRRERRARLLDRLAEEHGCHRRDFPEVSWSEMWDDVLDAGDDVDDHDARGIDDDSGYGPDSYFAHAMDKDD